MNITRLSKILAVILALFFIIVVLTGLTNVELKDVPVLLKNKVFWKAMWFSVKTATIATLLAFVFGVPAGYYMARNKRVMSRVFDAVFDIPVVVPPLIVGVLLLNFFNTPLLREMGNFIFTTKGAIVAQFFVAVPFTIKAAKSAFELIPPIYERIAMTLGASPMRSFFDTTFKIAIPSIVSGLILTWLRCLGEFGATLMVGGAMPGRTQNIPIFIYMANTGGDFKIAMTASILSIIVAFVGVLVVKYLTTKQ